MEPLARHAARGQVVHERAGNGYDGVEPPQRAALQPFVEAIPPVATRETVDGRNHGNAQATRYGRIQYIRPIPVCVDHVGTQPATQPRDLRPLLQIAPPRDCDREDLDPSVPERREERVVERAGKDHSRYAGLDLGPARSQDQRRNNRLLASDFGGGKKMEHGNPGGRRV